MGFLLRIFSKNGLFVFFIFLQITSIVLIFNKNSMQQSWISGQIAAFNSWVSGSIDEGASYFKLKQINEQLVAQNKDLMVQLYGKNKSKNPQFRKVHDTIGGGQIYTFVDGEVVFNSINRRDNYYTINRGRLQGVSSNMGVIAPKGIAGIVINTTDNYSLVKSILSVNKIKISASLKKSGYFGTLSWKGDDTRTMTLSDIPKYVPLKVGDTVVTDGKSMRFVTDALKELDDVVVAARSITATEIAGVRGGIVATDMEIDGEKFAFFAHADAWRWIVLQ